MNVEPRPPGSVSELGRLTWEEARGRMGPGSVGVLPVGAVEAHGPHLPLDTDVIIARAMAEEGARRLAARGLRPLLLPPLAYSPAPFAAGFAGTVAVEPDTLRRLVGDIHRSLTEGGLSLLALANAHLDPAHVTVLRELAAEHETMAFPDVTRRRWAGRLTEEFTSGACHAGRYETSIVLAAAPDRVRLDRMATLEPVPHSLSEAIREGRSTFQEAGGDRAYFGWPADATEEEGRATIRALGEILEEAVLETLEEGAGPGARKVPSEEEGA